MTHPNRHQAGQALTELCIVGSLLLIALLLSLQLLMKLAELRYRNLQAARYAAWERTVWLETAPLDTATIAAKGRADIERELTTRVFAAPEQALLAGQDPQQDIDQDPLLNVTRHRDGRRLTLARQDHDNPPGTLSIQERPLENFSTSVSRALAPLMDYAFDVNTGGFLAARVQTPVRDLGALLPQLVGAAGSGELVLEDQLILLTDGWGAGSPQQVRSTVSGLLPADALQETLQVTDGAREFGQTIGRVMPWLQPFESLTLGHVDVDVVPLQRWLDMPR